MAALFLTVTVSGGRKKCNRRAFVGQRDALRTRCIFFTGEELFLESLAVRAAIDGLQHILILGMVRLVFAKLTFAGCGQQVLVLAALLHLFGVVYADMANIGCTFSMSFSTGVLLLVVMVKNACGNNREHHKARQ